jgi:protein PhnA
MKNIPNCIKCGCEFTYEDRSLYVCPECGYEWTEALESKDDKPQVVVKDAYGNLLKDGDSVTIIKDIKVKGTSSAIKIGVKVKDIRLVEEVNGHNIEAKVPGFGSMLLKSEVVKKCHG